MKDLELLSDSANQKHYSEKNFFQLWIKSYLSAHSIILHSVFILLSILLCVFVKIEYPFKFREYVSIYSDISLTYSSTIIGFLLVSFSILLSISNVRNTFSYFVKENATYKKPLLKIILDHFIFPIGVFLLLLIFSLLIKIINGIAFIGIIEPSVKAIVFRIIVALFAFTILLSISELVSYFYNIYRFIVITSLTISKEYEEQIIQKIYVDKIKVDVLEQDDAKEIVNNMEKQKSGKPA